MVTKHWATHYAYGVPLNVRFDQRFNSSGPKNDEFKSKQQICVKQAIMNKSLKICE